jgi:hypothetical protein
MGQSLFRCFGIIHCDYCFVIVCYIYVLLYRKTIYKNGKKSSRPCWKQLEISDVVKSFEYVTAINFEKINTLSFFLNYKNYLCYKNKLL